MNSLGRRTDRRKNKQSNLRFIVLLVLLSMIAVFLGFQIGNSFFASQVATDEEEMEIYEAVPEAEEIEDTEIEEDITEEEIVSQEEDNDISGEAVLDDEPDDQDQPVEDSIEEDATSDYYIQVGAFGSGENANNLKDDLENRGFQARVEGTEPYRVQVAGGNNRDNAEEIASELQNLGFETLIISQ